MAQPVPDMDASDIDNHQARFCPECWSLVSTKIPSIEPKTATEAGTTGLGHATEFQCEVCALVRAEFKVAKDAPLVFRYSDPSQITAYALPGDPAAEFVLVQHPPFDLSSDLVFERATEWMSTCRQTHKQCQVTGQRGLPLMPTRVIDVGGRVSESDSSPSTPAVKLHVSHDGERGEYICLSYCWGGDQYKTLGALLPELTTTGFPMDQLSLTVTDAIEATRRLGLRYLWVDALCIVQDDDEDKGREIVKMGAIYKNAVVTITAATARAASDGFLRAPRAFPFVVVRTILPNGKIGTVRLTLTKFFNVGKSRSRLLHPLHARGWCLQEALLSPRRLMFSAFGVEMLCQNGDGDVIGRTPFGGELWKPHTGLGVKHPIHADTRLPPGIFGGETITGLFKKMLRLDLMPYASRIELWKTIVTEFSARDLSFADDRLAALAGIAGELQRAWKDDYAFGMWRKLLAGTLLWTALPPGRRLDLAPTWSWASTNSPVTFTDVWHVGAGDFDVEVADDDPVTADAPRSRLIARGTLIRPSDGPPPAVSRAGGAETYDVWYDTDEVCVEQDYSYLVVLRDTRPISGKPYAKGARRVNTTYLVLRTVDEGTYARVGIAGHTQRYHDRKDPDTRWSELSKGPKMQIRLV